MGQAEVILEAEALSQTQGSGLWHVCGGEGRNGNMGPCSRWLMSWFLALSHVQGMGLRHGCGAWVGSGSELCWRGWG